MDMSYSTIQIFGIQRRHFRDKKLAYMVTSVERMKNHPINVLDIEMGATIFFTDEDEDGSHF